MYVCAFNMSYTPEDDVDGNIDMPASPDEACPTCLDVEGTNDADEACPDTEGTNDADEACPTRPDMEGTNDADEACIDFSSAAHDGDGFCHGGVQDMC